MEYESILQIIVNSCGEDWLEVPTGDGEYTFTYKKDLNIRFVDNHFGYDSFIGNWTQHFPDKNSKKYSIFLYYGASPIEEFTMISVDGGRASIPIPCSNNMTITEIQYYAAKFGTQGNEMLDDYLDRARIHRK